MVDKTDDLIISVSTDTSTIARSLNKLVGDVGTASTAIQSRFEKVGKGIDKSIATSLQSQINGIVGIGVQASKEWTGALANQGKALDDLRTKYVPLFSVQNTYLNNLKDIKAAHAVGAISADEMSTAIARETSIFNSTVVAVNKQNAAYTKINGATKLTSNQLLNLSRQGNDVITMFALGAPVTQIFASQIGQVYDALEQGSGGVVGSLKAAGTAVLGLAVAFPEVAVAIAIAAAAFSAYALLGPAALPKADDILKAHGELIRDLKEYYDGASESATKYGTVAGITLDAIARRQAKAAKPVADKANEDFFNTIGVVNESITGGERLDLNREFKPVAPAIQQFRKDLQAGSVDFDAFAKTISNSSLGQDLKDQLLEGAQGLREINAAADKKPINDFQKAMADVNAAIGDLDDKKLQETLKDIAKGAGDGEVSVKDIGIALDDLSRSNPSMAGPLAAIKTLITAAHDAAAAVNGIGGRVGSDLPKIQVPAMTDTDTHGNPLKFGQIGETSFDNRFGDDDSVAKQLQKQKDDIAKAAKQAADEAERARKKAAADAKRAAQLTPEQRAGQRDANAERDNLKNGQDHITQLEAEAKAIGLNGIAQDTLRFKTDLLTKATDKGRELTPAYRAEIDKLADSYSKAATQVAFLKEQSDLTFEGQQNFRSPTEQKVAGTLRSTGIDPESAKGQALASQIRLNEALSQGRDLAVDFASGFASDLENGVKATQALGNALGKLGDKLIDMALNQAINGLFGNLAGALGGGGTTAGAAAPASGGLFSGIGKILGFADGTDNAPGGLSWVGERGPELMNVPKGAQVIPNHKLNGPRMPALMQGGGGSAVTAPTSIVINAQGADREGLARVQQQVNQLKADLPGHIVNTVKKAQNSRVLK